MLEWLGNSSVKVLFTSREICVPTRIFCCLQMRKGRWAKKGQCSFSGHNSWQPMSSLISMSKPHSFLLGWFIVCPPMTPVFIWPMPSSVHELACPLNNFLVNVNLRPCPFLNSLTFHNLLLQTEDCLISDTQEHPKFVFYLCFPSEMFLFLFFTMYFWACCKY